MSQEIFERTKSHVNISTIGHVDHGKSSLTTAIMKVQASKGLADYTDSGTVGGDPLYDDNTVTMAMSYVEYETENRHYALVDCPGHADHVKNMITGSSQTDGFILVVSAADGPMPQTSEHLLLARHIGVEHLVVFMNKMDIVDDEEMIDLVEMEVREVINSFGFDGDNVPFVRGSARKVVEGHQDTWEAEMEYEENVVPIEALLQALDTHIPEPVRDTSGSFFMPVEDVFSISGKGTVVTGRIVCGTVNVNDMVSIMGLDSNTGQRKVTSVEMFGKILNEGRAGDNAGLLLENTEKYEVERGHVLCQPGSASAYTQFIAEIYMLSGNESGLSGPIFNGYVSQYFFHTIDITGTMSFPQGTQVIMPGDNASLEITLEKSAVMETGTKFAIRQGGKTVGTGTVIQAIA